MSQRTYLRSTATVDTNHKWQVLQVPLVFKCHTSHNSDHQNQTSHNLAPLITYINSLYPFRLPLPIIHPVSQRPYNSIHLHYHLHLNGPNPSYPYIHILKLQPLKVQTTISHNPKPGKKINTSILIMHRSNPEHCIPTLSPSVLLT